MKKRGLKILAALLALILMAECLYCVAVFTDWVPGLTTLRRLYIETAMSTMNHKWLATSLIPADVVQEVLDDLERSRTGQLGLNSGNWVDAPAQSLPEDPEAAFFARFPELEESSVRAWTMTHPEVLAGGWDKFYVNEAGLEDAGTAILTRQGDQVLAIDAENGLLVIRVKGEGYRGVLVLGKDPTRLRCAAAAQWGVTGQRIGDIARDNGALVALTGSGFRAVDGAAEGAEQSGYAMCGGVSYGTSLKSGYKRIELRSDDRLYVVDTQSPPHPDCTDATEWTPALVIDGAAVLEQEHYVALNPRACLGQTADGTVMMLCIEGRYLDSLGCDAAECARILVRYGAHQAMNLDGGTSAVLWYQGQVITRCSDRSQPDGRLLPNAWLYG